MRLWKLIAGEPGSGRLLVSGVTLMLLIEAIILIARQT